MRFSVNWTKYTFDGIEHIPPIGPLWIGNFLLPTLLIHQSERAVREGELLSPTETADNEANGEVFPPCSTCPLCTIHYLVFDGNDRAHVEDNVDPV